MAGFMMGDTAAHIGRPFWLAVTYDIEQICQLKRAAGGACHPASQANPALDVGAGVPARSQRRGAKIGALKLCAEMRSEDARQCRHVGQRDGDVTVEAAGANQRRIKPSGIVAGGNYYHALAAFETVQAFEQGICDAAPPVVVPLSGSTRRDRVDFVDEQNAGTVLPRLGESIADRLRHMAEMSFTMTLPLAIAGGDKVHIGFGFARDRSRKGGLAHPRRTG